MTIATRQLKKHNGNNFYQVLNDSEKKAVKRHVNNIIIVLEFDDNSVIEFNNKFHTVEEFREIRL